MTQMSKLAKADKARLTKTDVEAMKLRKAALKVANVPKDVRLALNLGLIESKNLAEILSLDMSFLFFEIVDTLQLETKQSSQIAQAVKKVKILAQLQLCSDFFLSAHIENPKLKIFEFLAQHESDTVRSWAAYLAGSLPADNLKARFSMLYPFAADSHMGVREYAWMSLRPHIVKDFSAALPHLKKWAQDKNPYVRRCAMESTRPRGVWCRHFELLKEKPGLAVPLLELLKNDAHKYVQNSVANWLNDASKSKKEFVIELCDEWSKNSKNPQSAYIIKRALRSIKSLPK